MKAQLEVLDLLFPKTRADNLPLHISGKKRQCYVIFRMGGARAGSPPRRIRPSAKRERRARSEGRVSD
jgi:hypothetical protein